MPERRTTTELIRLHPNEPADLQGDLPPWLAAFIREALRETDSLCENGADQAAAARTALLKKLVGAAQAWLDAELDATEAAREKGVCEETIRRAVRDGRIPDRRANPKGRHHVRRGDSERVAPRTVDRPMNPARHRYVRPGELCPVHHMHRFTI